MVELVGWVQIHRKLCGKDLWTSEPFTRGQAWVDIILLANHKPGHIRSNGVRIELARGQLGWSENKLGERWSWSRGKVRRFLKELESDNQIVQQKSQRNPTISIVNYEEYQSDGTTDDTSDGQETDKRRTIDGTVTNNDNNDNNDNKEKRAEPKGSKKKIGFRLPDDWVLPDDWRQWADLQGHKNPTSEADKFTDYWHSKAGKDASKVDWLATWRNWIRRSIENGTQYSRSDKPRKTTQDERRATAINAFAPKGHERKPQADDGGWLSEERVGSPIIDQ